MRYSVQSFVVTVASAAFLLVFSSAGPDVYAGSPEPGGANQLTGKKFGCTLFSTHTDPNLGEVPGTFMATDPFVQSTMTCSCNGKNFQLGPRIDDGVSRQEFIDSTQPQNLKNDVQLNTLGDPSDDVVLNPAFNPIGSLFVPNKCLNQGSPEGTTQVALGITSVGQVRTTTGRVFVGEVVVNEVTE